MATDAADSPLIISTSWGICYRATTCRACQGSMLISGIMLYQYLVLEESAPPVDGENGLLIFAEMICAEAICHIQSYAPWLRPRNHPLFGRTYWTHHCTVCGELQGDDVVFSEKFVLHGPNLQGGEMRPDVRGVGELIARGCVFPSAAMTGTGSSGRSKVGI